ncbi:hypothetical protein McanMca71_007283 [Microsporum canis]
MFTQCVLAVIYRWLLAGKHRKLDGLHGTLEERKLESSLRENERVAGGENYGPSLGRMKAFIGHSAFSPMNPPRPVELNSRDNCKVFDWVPAYAHEAPSSPITQFIPKSHVSIVSHFAPSHFSILCNLGTAPALISWLMQRYSPFSQAVGSAGVGVALVTAIMAARALKIAVKRILMSKCRILF